MDELRQFLQQLLDQGHTVREILGVVVTQLYPDAEADAGDGDDDGDGDVHVADDDFFDDEDGHIFDEAGLDDYVGNGGFGGFNDGGIAYDFDAEFGRSDHEGDDDDDAESSEDEDFLSGWGDRSKRKINFFGTQWFDTEWHQVDGYYDSMVDYPDDFPELPDTRPGQRLLGDQRWKPEEIDARAKELCSRDLEAIGKSDLAALYDYLREVDEALRHIRDDWPIKQFDINHQSMSTSVIPPKSATTSDPVYEAQFHVYLAKQLLQRHKHIRVIVQERSRPHLRPLNLNDMPHEIVARIVETCGANTGGLDKERWRTLKALRLTCRAISVMIAPELFRSITIYPTRESLSRLNYISRHPHLSKSITSARISVAYYRPGPARSMRSFVDYGMVRIITDFFSYDEEEGDTSCMAHGNEAAALRMLVGRWHAWQQQIDGDNVSAFEAAARQCPLTTKAYETYQLNYAEFEAIVADGVFANVVAGALARMPKVKNLTISDHTFDGDRVHKYKRRSKDGGGRTVVRVLASPMAWDVMAGIPDIIGARKPASLLADLLSTLGSRGVNLIQLSTLDMRVTLPDDLRPLWTPNDSSRQHLAQLARRLVSFKLAIRPDPDANSFRGSLDAAHDASRLGEQLAALDGFLDQLLSSESLYMFEIDLKALRRSNRLVETGWYMPSLMKARPWPKLHEMSLRHVCLDSRKLKNFLGDRPLYIRTLHKPHMSYGTWAQALDLMRERYDNDWEDHRDPPEKLKGLSIDRSLWSVTGGECYRMGLDYYRAFAVPPGGWPKKNGEYCHDGYWQAQNYIYGKQAENPCRPYVEDIEDAEDVEE